MPLLSRELGFGLGLSVLLGSGCFEDTTQESSAATDPSDAGTDGSTDAVDEGDDTGLPRPGDESAGCVEGCLDDENQCFAGLSDEACGFEGERCVSCGAGAFCGEGVCRPLPLCTPENCAGCCDGDVCVAGFDASACGDGGEQCAVCSGDSTCAEGSCELPCETTCDGCCDPTGDCISLEETSETACGRQGEACGTCGDAFGCSEGVCISLDCQENCDGCCIADECLTGRSLQACGSSGAACSSCPAGTLCEEACVADPDGLWQIFVESATTTDTKPNGANWDPVGTPDPYVELTFGGLTALTDFVDDTTAPVWNELLFEGLSTDDIVAEPGIFEIWDDDITPDESIGRCLFNIGEDQFGVPLQADCTDEEGTVLWSLQFSIQSVE